MSDLDRDLTRVFSEHADTLGPSLGAGPLSFDDVRGKATSIRRRRRIASGLAVAAAVAVIVPTAVVASKGLNSDGVQPATGPTVVTDSSAPTPTSSPVMGQPHVLSTTGLPTGAPPKLDLVTTGDLAVATTAEARVSWTQRGVVVEAGGRTFGPYPTSGGLARDAAGTAIAWVTDEGDVMLWRDGGGEPTTVGSTALLGAQVEALTGDGRVYLRGSGSDGTPASVVLSDGTAGPVDPGREIVQVRDATDDGRVLGSTEISDGGSCSSVLDGRQTLLSTCDYQLDSFSPDGTYVLASEPWHSGVGSSTIAVFSTAGDLTTYRLNRTQQMRFYNEAVWEDDTHVLFSMFQDGEWSVVRMDVQGAMEYAVPPQPGEFDQTPFRFETR